MSNNSILEFLGQRVLHHPLFTQLPRSPRRLTIKGEDGKEGKGGSERVVGGKGKVWLGERKENVIIVRQGGAEKGGVWMESLMKEVGSKTWSEVWSLLGVGSLYGLLYVA